jgi:hypothetical protein
MIASRARLVDALLVLLLVLAACGSAEGRARTDVVTLVNGDRITGEVKRLDRGQLEFKTDDVGTLYVEWDKVASLEASRAFEVGTTDGRRFLGALGAGTPRTLVVSGVGDPLPLRMAEVTLIAPIGEDLWSKLDGSLDAGFSYTRSSDIAQLNFNSETFYRRARFEGRLGISATVTRQKQGAARDDRGSIDASYIRYLGAPWFLSAGARFETNESLGIRLRSQAGGAFGPRLVNTNRAQMTLGGGLVVNDERGVDAEPTRNIEGMLSFATSYFTYDRPRTNLDLSVQYYPSLNNPGRQRLQLDAAAKREVFKDFFLALNVFDSYDSRPPNSAIDTNDVGIVLSIGWSY